ncbi:hypothetical protein EKI43_24900, partial [Salmonella enterica]|nr:hypothetical protein [Salmonella enterica]
NSRKNHIFFYRLFFCHNQHCLLILILPSVVPVLMVSREKQICQHQQARQELLAKEALMEGEDRGQQ